MKKTFLYRQKDIFLNANECAVSCGLQYACDRVDRWYAKILDKADALSPRKNDETKTALLIKKCAM